MSKQGLLEEACRYLEEYPPLPRSFFESDREYNDYVDWTLEEYGRAKRIERFDATGYAWATGYED